jgi:hypothetical protein
VQLYIRNSVKFISLLLAGMAQYIIVNRRHCVDCLPVSYPVGTIGSLSWSKWLSHRANSPPCSAEHKSA